MYFIRPGTEAEEKGARIVGVRWADTRKGEEVRNRQVRMDVNKGKGHTDDMSAPPPPLIASHWVVSLFASKVGQGIGDSRLMSVDFTWPSLMVTWNEWSLYNSQAKMIGN